MRTSPQGFDLIKHFEGCRLEVYKCSAGVPTIGWGHTGPDVKPGMRWTQQQADRALEDDLVKFERAIAEQIKVELTQSQFDALVSFAFNLGPGALFKSTLRKLLNAGDYAGAAGQFPLWNKAAGKVLAGLTRRRLAEQALFRGDDWRKAA